MGDQSKQVKYANAANEAALEFQEEQSVRNYYQAMDNYYLNQYETEVTTELQDAQLKQQFEDSLKISDAQREAQLQAYDISEQRYRTQLQLNQRAYDETSENLNRRLGVTVDQYYDQFTDQQNAFQQQAARSAIDARGQQNIIDFADDEFSIAEEQNRRAEVLERRSLLQESGLLGEQKIRDTALRQAETDSITAQRTQIEDTKNVQANIRLKQQEQLQIDKDQVQKLKDLAATEDLDAQLAFEQTLSNIAFQKQDQRLQGIQQKGKARARGRKGKSAERTINTTAALTGLSVAKLTNAAFFATEQRENQKSAYQTRTEQLALQEDSLKIKGDMIGFEEQLEAIQRAAATSQLDAREDRSTADADFTAAQRKQRDAEVSQQLLETSDKRTLADSIAGLARDRQQEGAKLAIETIAQNIGFSAEQFELNAERLGASIISEADSVEEQLNRLEQQKYEADFNAFAARMLPPRFADDALAPYEIPTPEYIKPQPGAAPVGASPMIKIQQKQERQSGLSKALAIGGAVLSVAAIPFTAGASLAAAGVTGLGFLGTSAAAATGIGLSTAGAAANMASKYTY